MTMNVVGSAFKMEAEIVASAFTGKDIVDPITIDALHIPKLIVTPPE